LIFPTWELQLKFFSMLSLVETFSLLLMALNEAELQLKCIQVVVLVMLANLPFVFNVNKIGEIITCQLIMLFVVSCSVLTGSNFLC